MSDHKLFVEMERRNYLRSGCEYVNDTTVRGTTGETDFNYWELYCVRNTQFKVLEMIGFDNSSDVTTGTTFPAGTRLRGRISRFQTKAATNIVLAYYGDSGGRTAPFS